MKTTLSQRRDERGSATIITVILMLLLLIFIGSGVHNLHQLDRELQVLDQRQVRRLQTGSPNRPGPAPVTAPVAPAAAKP